MKKEIDVKDLKITLPEGLKLVSPAKLIEEGVVELRVQATKAVDNTAGITVGYGDTEVVSSPKVETLPEVNLTKVENTGGTIPGDVIGLKLVFDGKVKSNLLKVETKGGAKVIEQYVSQETNISLKVRLPKEANADWAVVMQYGKTISRTVAGRTVMPTQRVVGFTVDKPEAKVGDTVVFSVNYKETAEFVDRPRVLQVTEGLKFKEDWKKEGKRWFTSYTVTKEGDQALKVVVFENMIHQTVVTARVKALSASVAQAEVKKHAK